MFADLLNYISRRTFEYYTIWNDKKKKQINFAWKFNFDFGEFDDKVIEIELIKWQWKEFNFWQLNESNVITNSIDTKLSKIRSFEYQRFRSSSQ